MKRNSLCIVIVNRGRAEKILTELRPFGIHDGLVMLGEGTVRNRVLAFFGLDETQKEVILCVVGEDSLLPIHELLKEEFRLNKKNRGIAFTLPLSRFEEQRQIPDNRRLDSSQLEYHCMLVIVDHGKSRDCIDLANRVQPVGGTILHGRGAGVPAGTIFPIKIEPEKDIVLMLMRREQIASVRERLIRGLSLDSPGNGILFVLPVTHQTGLYQGRED